MGGVINNPPFINTFHNPSASLVGTIVAIYEVGCCAGSIITAFVGEYLGRRKSIFIGAFIMLGGTAFQAGVSSTGALIGGRIVSGIGMVRLSYSQMTQVAESNRASSIPQTPSCNRKSRPEPREDASSASCSHV